MPYKNILVPVDFSKFSDGAADYAVFLAQKFCAEITLLHTVLLFQEDVDDQKNLEAFERVIKEKERKRKAMLNACRQEIDEKIDSVKSVMLRGYSAADSILEYLEKNPEIDLVMMGTHGRTGFSRFLAGSVTEKVVRFSPVGVVTIHADPTPQSIQKILVPIDFSLFSKIAVDKALKIAAEVSAELSFLHVVRIESHPEFYNISAGSILKDNPKLKKHIIDNMMSITKLREDQAQYKVLEGRAHQQIAQYAQKHSIDLIVMPTRGMSELEHLILGSTTERVVRIAKCPVLTVRN